VNSLKLLLRFLIVGGLLLMLLIPLLLIRGTIKERERYRNEAVHEVGASRAREQQLLGPVLVIPWSEQYRNETKDADGQVKIEFLTRERYDLYMPQQLQIGGDLAPDERRLGLFKVPVYTWNARVGAEFHPLPPVPGRNYGRAYLALGLSDVRGLVGSPALRVNGEVLAPQPGSKVLEDQSSGLHVVLPGEGERWYDTPISVELDFVLDGTRRLSIVPLGDDTGVTLTSSWPHPSFVNGNFLPNEREVGADGFKAKWAISSLAGAAQRQLRDALGNHSTRYDIEVLGVNLVDPVDVYTLADRASKYGILFILLTFVGFVLFELIRRLRIHPLQYLLVGLALAIFFLLLLSLSEHIAFWQAYLIAAAACIGLQGVYLTGVLRNRAFGLTFSGLLGALYAVLYLLLQSEGYALLMGSILLFAILAAIMWMTRKLDWYEVGANLR